MPPNNSSTTATRLARIETHVENILEAVKQCPECRAKLAVHESEIRSLEKADTDLGARCSALSGRMWGALISVVVLLGGAILAVWRMTL